MVIPMMELPNSSNACGCVSYVNCKSKNITNIIKISTHCNSPNTCYVKRTSLT